MFLNAASVFAGPARTTYQAKIIKPDGYPLEANNVNFSFTILDPAGSCILYSESFSNVNMGSSGGLVSFGLGNGVRTFPVSGSTFEQVFSNTTASLICDSAMPTTYSPLATDTRKILMQFNDGTGWQTLPAMTINAVPYAMYANDALKFKGKDITDFVQVSSLPTCGVSQAVRFNGAGFNCVNVGDTAGVTSGSVITALGYTPANGASVTAVTATVDAVSSTIASVSSTVYSVSSTVSSLQNSVAASFAAITNSQWITSGTSIYYASRVGVGTSSPATLLDVGGWAEAPAGLSTGANITGNLYVGNTGANIARTRLSSNVNGGFLQWNRLLTASGVVQTDITKPSFNFEMNGTTDRFIFQRSAASSTTLVDLMSITGSGRVGIGVSTPVTALDVSGGIRIGSDSSSCTGALAGTLRYSAGVVEYCNGTSWAAFGVSGAGILAINGLVSGSQTFAFGSAGTTPSVSSVGTVHTFNFPYASVATTTAGLISYSDYLNFSNKASAVSLTTLSSTVGSVSTTVNSVSSTVASLQSSVAASLSAITSSQWTTSGTNIFYGLGNVGVGTTQLDGAFNVARTGAPGTLVYIDTYSGTSGINPALVGRSSRGVAGAASATLQSDKLLFIGARGDTGTGFSNASPVNIILRASENWSTVSQGTQIEFSTSTNGTSASLERMRITNAGNVGIGTINPAAKLDVSGAIRIGVDNSSCIAGLAGTIRYNTGVVEYCNGTTWVTFGAAGAGITAMNGLVSGSQTFAFASSGTAPNVSSTGTVHTFNFPYASVATTTAGVISYNDYLTFTNKQAATSAAIATTLGYTPANSVSVTALAASYAVITSSQWSTNGTSIYYNSGNVGIGINTPGDTADEKTLQITETTGKPVLKLHRSGSSVYKIGINTDDKLYITNNSGPTALASATKGIVIDMNGYVGIATSAPTQKLEVDGFISSTNLSDNSLSRSIRLGMVTDTTNTTNSFGLGDPWLALDGGTNAGSATLQIVGNQNRVLNVRLHDGSLLVPYGNIGVGLAAASAPASRLHISDNSAVIMTLERQNNQNSLIEYKNTLGSIYAGQITSTTDWGIGTGVDLGTSGVFRVTNSGRVYIGGTTAPTARLQVTPGTSSVAPVKLMTGTLLTTPQAGAIEYDGTDYYVTDSSNVRRTIATASTGGVLNNTSVVSSTSGITLWPAAGNSVVVSSTVASTNSTTGALIVNGGAGIAGALNVGGVISGSATIKGTGFRANQGAPDNADSSTNGYAFGSDGDTGIFSPGTGSANGVMAFYSNNVEKMRLTNNGLGIGVSAPTVALEVSGVIRSNRTGFAKVSLMNTSPAQEWWMQNNASKFAITDVNAGNIDRLTIDTTGNVGIGTTSPSYLLDLYSAASPTLRIRSTSNDASNGPIIKLTEDLTENGGFVRYHAVNNTFDLGVLESGVENKVMSINRTTGNVGIGTISPFTPLSVSSTYANETGSTTLGMSIVGAGTDWVGLTVWDRDGDTSTTDDGDGTLWWGDNTTDSLRFAFRPSSAVMQEKMRLTATGRLGIGTSSPQVLLTLDDSLGTVSAPYSTATDKLAVISDGNSVIQITTPSNSTGAVYFSDPNDRDPGGIGYSHLSDSMYFRVNDATRMTITASGAMGLGTGSPNMFLHLKNTTGISDTVYIDRSDTSPNLDVYSSYNGASNVQSGTFAYGVRPTDDQWQIWERGANAAWTNLFTVTKTGSVGVGTQSPLAPLEVVGAITTKGGEIIMQRPVVGGGWARGLHYTPDGNTNATANGLAGIGLLGSGATQTSIYLAFGAAPWASTTGMHVLSNGNVGIGLTTPTALLHVNGAALATAWNTSSDQRLKENIKPIENPVDKILQLRGVEFDWRKDVEVPTKHDETHDIGVIAQEVEKVFPEAVTTPKTGYKSVAYSKLVAPLIEAVKSLYHRILGVEAQQVEQARAIASKADQQALDMANAKIQKLESENAAKEKELQEMKLRLEKIEKALSSK